MEYSVGTLNYSPSYNARLKKHIKKLEYNPLKTIEKCNNWLKNNYKMSHVDYQGFYVRIANAINRQLQILFHLYPEINTIKRIDNIDDAAELYLKNTVKGRKILEESRLNFDKYIFSNFSNTHAIALAEDCEYQGIWFNIIDFFSPDIIYKKIKNDILSNHLSQSTYGIERTVSHEFAHHVHEFLKREESDGFINSLWAMCQYNDRSAIKNGLSMYAAENIYDFFAEGLCEYIHNPNSRSLATKIGKETNKAFMIFRNRKQVNAKLQKMNKKA